MKTLTVHKVIFRTDELFELQLERETIQFEPGSCLALFNDDESRPYSIASGTGEDKLRFLLRQVVDGTVSQWLALRKPGDKVQVSAPFGWFRPGAAIGSRSVFIATGTGIAPFLSYFRSHSLAPPECCLYGVRRCVEAFNLEELQRVKNFSLALSQEQTDDHFYGRVTGLLEQIPLADDIHYYLCGLDAMIAETSVWLENHGVAYTQIHREIFFYEDEQH
ncbi:ferredoxin--NADP+ reductase [Desulfuromusa kysingii]|uniref:Ferredoxin--NADP+ reductase n=1 Tax=Desulfuromusa kysingii TaxID=37625 RepID=A0A1H4DDD9_9BACT|nr:FAD-binding oxidoreductase [Desulfuromusa kysingii]SEA70419.1 ferredoxin--NADP+ reductase [Desulfuromusa kysingii]